MARGFGATDGAGSTDSIVLANTTLYSPITLHWWFTRRSVGGGGIGRLFQKATTGDTGPRLFAFSNPPDELRLLYPWTTSAGGNAEWRITAPAASATTWHALTMTYDDSSTSNDPVFWVDGSSVSVTEAVAPSGSPSASTEAWVLGNRKSDNARVWDGQIAQFAVWDRILSNADIAALALGYAPRSFPRGLRCDVPLVRDVVDWAGGAATITGTAVQPHPPIRYPGRATRRGFASTPPQALPAGALLGVA